MPSLEEVYGDVDLYGRGIPSSLARTTEFHPIIWKVNHITGQLKIKNTNLETLGYNNNPGNNNGLQRLKAVGTILLMDNPYLNNCINSFK